MKTFFTISGDTQCEINEKHSKFLGFLFYCESIENFEQELNKIKQMYPDASHHCYGYRIGLPQSTEYANDNGEPGGTAGLPILNKLKSADINNVGLIVVRYFGGTKLGKPGLIKAYGTCAELCLDKAYIMQLIPAKKIEIQYPYHESNLIEQLIKKYDCKIDQSEYLTGVTCQISCPEENAEPMLNELTNYEHKDIKSTPGKSYYMPYDK